MRVAIILTGLLPFVAGCIPGHAIGGEAEQVVTVGVSDLDGVEVQGAKVTFAYDHRAIWTYTDLPNDDASFLERSVEGEGVVGENGLVELTFPTVTVCAFTFPINIFPCDDPLEDNVTGVPYLFGVELDGDTEYFSLPVVAGDEIEGEMFSLTIVSVGDATPREPGDDLEGDSN